MSESVTKVASWMYEGIWSGLTAIFRVPRKPPSIPASRGVRGGSDPGPGPGTGEVHESFQPAPGFLRYLKYFFWLIYLLIIASLTILGIAITFKNFWVGMILLLALFIIMILTGIIAFLAIHLRYDTTWYVMTDRSLRIRRGIWIIHETTITFENIQNVNVSQGPVQRYFGISDVVVQTAGGGCDSKNKGFQVTNQGIIEGIANASEIRDRILGCMRESVSAGLGDEADGDIPARGRPGWAETHLSVLREIRDEMASFPL